MTKVSRVQGLPTVLAQHQCNALRHVVVERLCHARHGAVPEECHRTRRSQTTCWVSQALPLRRNYVEVQLANELWMSFFLPAWALGLCILQVIQKNIIFTYLSFQEDQEYRIPWFGGNFIIAQLHFTEGHSEQMNQRLHTAYTQTHI